MPSVATVAVRPLARRPAASSAACHLRDEPAAGDIAVEVGILTPGDQFEREIALGRGDVVEFMHDMGPGDCCCERCYWALLLGGVVV